MWINSQPIEVEGRSLERSSPPPEWPLFHALLVSRGNLLSTFSTCWRKRRGQGSFFPELLLNSLSSPRCSQYIRPCLLIFMHLSSLTACTNELLWLKSATKRLRFCSAIIFMFRFVFTCSQCAAMAEPEDTVSEGGAQATSERGARNLYSSGALSNLGRIRR